MSKSKPHIVVTVLDDDIRSYTTNGRWAKFRYLNSLRQRVHDELDVTPEEAHELDMAQVVYGPEWWQIYIGYQRLKWREAGARRRAALKVETTAALASGPAGTKQVADYPDGSTDEALRAQPPEQQDKSLVLNEYGDVGARLADVGAARRAAMNEQGWTCTCVRSLRPARKGSAPRMRWRCVEM